MVTKQEAEIQASKKMGLELTETSQFTQQNHKDVQELAVGACESGNACEWKKEPRQAECTWTAADEASTPWRN